MKTCSKCGYKFNPVDYAREDTMNCPRCGATQKVETKKLESTKLEVPNPLEPEVENEP